MLKNIYKILIIFILLFSSFQSVCAEEQGKITGIEIQKNIILIKTSGGLVKSRYFILDGNSSDQKRFVIDFENANLTTNSISGSDGLNIRINQFSVKPLVSRMVITVPKEQIASFKMINGSGSQIKFGFNSSSQTFKKPENIKKTEEKLISEKTNIKEKPSEKIAETDKKNTEKNNIKQESDNSIRISGENIVQIELSMANLKYKMFRLSSPERLVLDLYNLDIDNVKSLIPEHYSKSLIINIRASKLSTSPKLVRVVFDLAQKGVDIDDNLKDNKKLIITLNPLVSESMQQSLKELKKIRNDLKVVIDAGHGGYDSGAVYSGVEEKTLTLSMTKQLKDILQNSKIEVIETRKDDRFISLDERVNITRRAQPDLFVSVHCNALQSSSSIKGIETYYFTPQSRSFANTLHKKIVNYTKAPDRQVRKARFVVIRETMIPSVLLETGFMSNPSERDKLSDKEYQALIVKSIAEGILEYLTTAKTSQTAILSPK